MFFLSGVLSEAQVESFGAPNSTVLLHAAGGREVEKNRLCCLTFVLFGSSAVGTKPFDIFIASLARNAVTFGLIAHKAVLTTNISSRVVSESMNTDVS